MGMGMASIRMARLNNLMHYFLSYRHVSGKELLESLGYSSLRTLQRDISYLKSEYSVNISYDFSKHIYTCRDSGHFVMYFSLSREEALLLATGLSLVRDTLPMESTSHADSMWDKLRPFLPEDIAGVNECGLPDINLLLPGKKLKKYRQIIKMLTNNITPQGGGITRERTS